MSPFPAWDSTYVPAKAIWKLMFDYVMFILSVIGYFDWVVDKLKSLL